MESAKAFPDVKDYINIYLYLQDVYQYRKRKDPEFSYAVWSNELGIKSRSFLRLVVVGKRNLTEEVTSFFIKNLKLNEWEKEYFSLLVLYSQSKSHDQKAFYGKKLTQMMRKELNQVEIEHSYDFLSNPVLSKLQTLLSFEDIERTPEKLSDLLSLSIADIEKSLQKLAQLQLVEKIEPLQTEWRAKQTSFKVADRPGDLGLEVYHRNALQEAIEAQKLPKEQRRYRSILLPMNEEEYGLFQQALNAFVNEQLAQFDVSSLKTRRLYQANFNVFTVSGSPEPVLERAELNSNT